MVPADGILNNDVDVDTPHTLIAALVAGPSKGLLTFGTDGSFSYDPNHELNIWRLEQPRT